MTIQTRTTRTVRRRSHPPHLWLFRVLLGLATVLALAVGTIVALVLTRDDTTNPTAPTPPVTPSTGDTGVTTSYAAAQPAYACWDDPDSSVQSLAGCTDPAGVQGLNWVFQDRVRADDFGSCSTHPAPGRDVFVACDLSWHGHPVHLHYAQWRSAAVARTHYGAGGAELVSDPRDDGALLLQWQPHAARRGFPDARWKAAEMLEGRRWTLAAYADDRAVVQGALATFGHIRDVREWRGTPR